MHICFDCRDCRGQTYFVDLKLPERLLYKQVNIIVITRAKDGDGMTGMKMLEYAKAVVDEMEKDKSGRLCYSEFAEMVRHGTTAVAVPIEAMVSLVLERILLG